MTLPSTSKLSPAAFTQDARDRSPTPPARSQKQRSGSSSSPQQLHSPPLSCISVDSSASDTSADSNGADETGDDSNSSADETDDRSSRSRASSTEIEMTIRQGVRGMSITSDMSVDTVMPADRMSVDRTWEAYEVFEDSDDGEEDSDAETTIDAAHGTSLPEPVPHTQYQAAPRAPTPTGVQHRQRILRHKLRRERHEALESPRKRARDGSVIVTHGPRHNGDSKCKHTKRLFRYFDQHRQLKEKIFRARLIKEEQERVAKVAALQEDLRRIEEANRRQIEQAEKTKNRQARHYPEELHGVETWQVWRTRMLAWKDLKTADVCEVDAIPFPVLFKAPYSPQLVTYSEVARFWALMTPYCPLTPEEFVNVIRRARSDFHPDRFAGCKYVAAFGCEVDTDARIIGHAATEVTSFLSDMIDEMKDVPSMDHLYKILSECSSTD